MQDFVQIYSPFNKKLENLQASDLKVLTNVTEGWYVEYKSELVNARALAKAVSAFGNTYGGWLFLGVKEHSKDNPVADSFPGVPKYAVDGVLQRLRKSIADHLNPSLNFDTKVLQGPCSDIGLAQDATVIVVRVPQSHVTPHVHKDGRIYRRLADSSEPVPETDRFILDQLWKRGDRVKKKVDEWIENDPEFSKAEADIPYIRLLFCVDPWFQRSVWLNAPSSEIRSILTSSTSEGFGTPFDMFYSASGGYIARQGKGNDPHNYVLTFRLRRDLVCDIVFPLHLYSPGSDLSCLNPELNGYNCKAEFIDILGSQGHTSPKIIDMNFLLAVLIGVVSKYQDLLRLADIKGKFNYKVRVLNTWRMVPFIDTKFVMDTFKTHGVPVIMDSQSEFPIGDGPESFRLAELPNATSSKDELYIQSTIMFAFIARLFGVDISESIESHYLDLLDTWKRAVTVQQNRKRNQFE